MYKRQAQANALAVQQKNFEDQQELNKQQVTAATAATEAAQTNAIALQENDYRNQKSLANSTASNNGIDLSPIVAALQGGNQTTSTGTTNVSRSGNTDNINFTLNGQTYTGKSREVYASHLAGTEDRNSQAWKNAYAQVLQQFPDINKQIIYKSPTQYFGMKG